MARIDSIRGEEGATSAAASSGETRERVFTLEGKLTPAALQNVMKRVADNRTACYLLVSDGLSEKCFFFPVGALRMTSQGRRRVFTLEELVLRHPKTTQNARSKLRAEVNERGRPFDEAAAHAGLTHVVRSCSAAIVRDELLDLIVWTGADYEYRETNPPPRFYDGRLSTVKLSFGVRRILEEVSEAIERFTKSERRRQFDGATTVKRLSGVKRAGGVPQETAEVVLELVGRQSTIDDVVVGARRHGIPATETATALFALADAGVLDIPQRPGPASSEERRARAEGEIQEIGAALDYLINELCARKRLAEAYESVGDSKQAAEHLKVVAEELEDRRRHNDAIDVWRKILKVSPRDFHVRRRIMGVFRRLKKWREVYDEGLVLAREYRKIGLLNRARQVFRFLISLRPDQVDIRRELIELLLATGETDDAIVELRRLGELYLEQGNEAAFLACQQKILSLDPKDNDALKLLQRAVRKSWSFMAPYAALAAGLLVVAMAGFFVYARVQRARAFESARANVFARLSSGDVPGARSALSAYEARAGFDAPGVDALRDRIDLVAARVANQRAAGLYGEARELELLGSPDVARARYAEIVSTYGGTDWEGRAQQRIGEIDKLRDEAARLGRRLKRLTQTVMAEQRFDEEYERAIEAARTLVRRFPWSEAALQASVPLRIDSVPQGAWVRIGAEDLGTQTPCTVERGIVPPFPVTLEKDGFEAASALIDLSAEHLQLPLHLTLTRKVRWKVRTDAPLVVSPRVSEGRVFLGGTDQRVYAVSAESGAARWTRPLGLFAEVTEASGPPVEVGGVVVVAEARGRVRAFAAADGTPLWSKSPGGPVSTVGATRNGAVLLREGDQLVARRRSDGASLWTLGDLGAPAVEVTMDERYGVVLWATNDARLHVIDPATGKLRGTVSTQSRAQAPPTFCGLGYAVATEDGLLRLIKSDGTRALWQKPLPGPVTAAPGYGSGLVYVGAGDRLLAFRVADGEAMPLQFDRFGAPLRASPVVHKGRVYVGTAGGAVYAMAATTGQVLWSLQTGGAILSPAQVVEESSGERTVLVASSDFSLYAVAD